MKQIVALTNFLIENLGLDRNKLHSEVTNAELKLYSEDLGFGGIVLAQIEYTAELDYENMDLERAAYLPAMIASWLLDNDSDRPDRLGNAEFQSNVFETHADFAIDIRFEEKLQLVEDPKGKIPFDGKRYRIEDVPVHTATAFELNGMRYESPDHVLDES